MKLDNARTMLNLFAIATFTAAILNLGGDQASLFQVSNMATLVEAVLGEVEQRQKPKEK